jgi:hypothetical protein
VPPVERLGGSAGGVSSNVGARPFREGRDAKRTFLQLLRMPRTRGTGDARFTVVVDEEGGFGGRGEEGGG